MRCGKSCWKLSVCISIYFAIVPGSKANGLNNYLLGCFNVYDLEHGNRQASAKSKS